MNLDPSTLRELVLRLDPGLIVVDTIKGLFGLEIETYDTVRQGWASWLPYDFGRDDWLPADRVSFPAVLALHHQHRERERAASDSVTRGYGAVAWFSEPDIVLDFDRGDPTDKADITRCLTVGKSRAGDPAGTVHRLEYDDSCSYGYLPAMPGATQTVPAGRPAPTQTALDQAAADARRFKAAGLSKRQAAAAAGVRKGGGARYLAFSAAWEQHVSV